VYTLGVVQAAVLWVLLLRVDQRARHLFGGRRVWVVTLGGVAWGPLIVVGALLAAWWILSFPWRRHAAERAMRAGGGGGRRR
jgi:hypothetical protein